jgi:hypothetical protein
VRIWDTQTLQLVVWLKEHSGDFNSITYSPNGKQLASESKNNTVGIWDTQTWQLRAQLKGHSDWVRSVAYSPDGKQLASGSSDNTVGIWGMQTLQPVTQLKGHSGSVRSVAYRIDGKQLASGSWDNSVFLWAKQSDACSLKAQENWQLIARFERGHRLSAGGAFLKGANISENNLELLKQKGANDDQVVPDHPCLSWIEDEEEGVIPFPVSSAPARPKATLLQEHPRPSLIVHGKSKKHKKTHEQEKARKPKKIRKTDHQPSPEDEADQEKCLTL